MNSSAMNGQVYQQHNQRNDQEQGRDAQPVSQAETYHPDDDQNSEKRLQHRPAFPASVTSGLQCFKNDDY